MDRFLRPSGAVYLVVALVFIGLLAGFPGWAAKNSNHKATHGVVAPAPAESKPPAIDHTAAGHTAGAPWVEWVEFLAAQLGRPASNPMNTTATTR